MSRDSVPVVGYLSFLASNSAIPNDFIALAAHLLDKKIEKAPHQFKPASSNQFKTIQQNPPHPPWNLIRRLPIRLPATTTTPTKITNPHDHRAEEMHTQCTQNNNGNEAYAVGSMESTGAAGEQRLAAAEIGDARGKLEKR